MIKTAVIGVGSIGQHHARIYHQSQLTQLVGVVDTNPAVGNRLAQLHQTTYFDNYQTMLEEVKPEAVSVSVPTHAHYKVVKDVLAAGCHVLVEKPIAATIEEGHEMIALAAKANRILRVGHVERFNPAIIELKRRLTNGALGHMFQIHARRLGPFPAHVKDVGVILDLAVHDLDIMRYLTDSEAVRLYAETKQELHAAHEDVFNGTVRFENDVLGILELNWLTPTKVREISVTGERGMFLASYLTQDLYFYENGDISDLSWDPLSILRGVSEGSMVRYPIRKEEPLKAELESFIRDTQDDKHMGASGKDGVIALQLAQSFVRSGKENQVIHL